MSQYYGSLQSSQIDKECAVSAKYSTQPPDGLLLISHTVKTSFAPTELCMMRTDSYHAHIALICPRTSPDIVEQSFAWVVDQCMQMLKTDYPPLYGLHSGTLIIDIPSLDFAHCCTFKDFQQESIRAVLEGPSLLIAPVITGRDILVRLDVVSTQDGGTKEYLDKIYGECPIRLCYE